MTECVISLGAVPARESYARLGETGYAERAFEECRRYEALLRRAIGPAPISPRAMRRRRRRSRPEAPHRPPATMPARAPYAVTPPRRVQEMTGARASSRRIHKSTE